METNSKIREAINAVYKSLWEHEIIYPKERGRLIGLIDAAVAEQPVRNCDVGTAEEQYSRMFRECYEWKCMDCKPSKDFRKCALSWSQKPYVKKEGGAR